ncbi:MAG: hypothetical protein OXC00_01530 [Acidimicrobiaceae bacterium]|nr:hypothetical protein [Acidimicrobiaceae bacterium]
MRSQEPCRREHRRRRRWQLCWCADTAVPRQIAEACLAHVVKGVEGAYQRGDLLTARAQIMQQWADYLAETQTNS